MSEAAPKEATLVGEPVPYEVRHSSEATQPRIDVDINGVLVVIPSDASLDPETLLRENARREADGEELANRVV